MMRVVAYLLPAFSAMGVAAQNAVDYDGNNNNLIDITTSRQLQAITHDLDGVGNPTASAWSTAFPEAAPGMGCPGGWLSWAVEFTGVGPGHADASDFEGVPKGASATTVTAALSSGGVPFEAELPRGHDVYVLIHHRNHLSVVSAQPATSAGCGAHYCADFRARQAYGSCTQLRSGTAYRMVAGDVTRSGSISWGDDDFLLRYQGRAAYAQRGANYLVDCDSDFSGHVATTEIQVILDNNLLSSQCRPRP